MKKFILIFALGVVAIAITIFFIKIDNGDAIQKSPDISWSQDNDHPGRITKSFEGRGNYLDVRQVADTAVQNWYKENPKKKVTATSIVVTLDTTDE